jgi:hypothetical protein
MLLLFGTLRLRGIYSSLLALHIFLVSGHLPRDSSVITLINLHVKIVFGVVTIDLVFGRRSGVHNVMVLIVRITLMAPIILSIFRAGDIILRSFITIFVIVFVRVASLLVTSKRGRRRGSADRATTEIIIVITG